MTRQVSSGRDSRIYGAPVLAEMVEILSNLALGKCGRDEEGEVEDAVTARRKRQDFAEESKERYELQV